PQRLEQRGIAQHRAIVVERGAAALAADAHPGQPAERQRHEEHQRESRAHPDGERAVQRVRAPHAPKSSTKRFLISSLRLSSPAGSTGSSFRSESLGLSAGYFTSGWPV